MRLVQARLLPPQLQHVYDIGQRKSAVVFPATTRHSTSRRKQM